MTGRTSAHGSAGGYADLLVPAAAYPPLIGATTARVAIVGGGLAGLNTALSLAEAGVRDVVLVEARTLGFGASGRNGGFVFAGYSLGEAALRRAVGLEHAQRLYRRTREAVEQIRGRITRYRIDCAPIDKGVIWANWFRDPAILRARQRLLAEDFDSHWQWLPQARLRELLATERYADGLFEPDALHLNPLAYLRGIAAAAAESGVRVFEHSPAQALRRTSAGWELACPAGRVRCEQVVLACGGYLARLVPAIDRAVLPIATYAMMTEPLGARLAAAIRTRAAVYDTRFAFDYYRVLDDNRLLWGGRISVRDRSAAAVARLLARDITRVYPQLAGVPIARAWSGLMSYARHQMPQISTHGDGLYWAQAFGGHGLAPTTVAGDVLAAAIAGDPTGLADFTPFGLDKVWYSAGLVVAQTQYAWLQLQDWRRARRRY